MFAYNIDAWDLDCRPVPHPRDGKPEPSVHLATTSRERVVAWLRLVALARRSGARIRYSIAVHVL